MKEKELQLKTLCDAICKAPKYDMMWDIWRQIIEQDFSDISPEFFKWV